MKDLLFKFMAWLITLPLVLASVAFAFFHTQEVPLTLSPFHAPFMIPVYIPVLSAIAIGFLFGCLMTWAATSRLRANNRAQKKKIHALEIQLASSSRHTYKSHNYSIMPTRLLEKRP